MGRGPERVLLKEWLGALGLVQPGEEKAKQVTDCCHQLPKRGCQDDRVRLFPEVHSRGAKDNSRKVQLEKFLLNTRKLFLKVRAVLPEVASGEV